MHTVVSVCVFVCPVCICPRNFISRVGVHIVSISRSGRMPRSRSQEQKGMLFMGGLPSTENNATFKPKIVGR